MATIPEALAVAIQHHQCGRLQTAEQIYRQILRADPKQADAIHLLGVLAHQAGKHELAAEHIAKAIAINGGTAVFHNNLAKVQHALGRLPEAIASCRRALQIDPGFAKAHDNLGVALTDLGRLDEAIACCRRAIELKPDLVEAHNNLGVALSEAGRVAEAIACFGRAVELDPGFVKAHNNLGNAYREQGKLDDCVASLDRALQLEPDLAELHNNLGDASKDQGKREEALSCYRRALELKPDLAETRQNLGMLLLLLGRYEEGWRQYEHRLECTKTLKKSASPRWQGERVEGKTILIQSEQGLGDTLQFLRYAPLVGQRSGARRVILTVQLDLVRLLAHAGAQEIEIAAEPECGGYPWPEHDCRVPLLSLPLALGLFEPLEITEAYVHADPALRPAWRERLGEASRARVGIVWAGNPEHKEDRLRSMPPETLLPQLSLPGIQLYSLQIGPTHQAAESLAAAGLIDLTAHIHDFADTAAFVAELDLVITVDTAVAHLAGAMGRPVWTMLPFQAEWRWGVTGETTRWYPTMKLFRQKTPGDWTSVIRDVTQALREY